MNCLIRNITIENQKINREQFFAIGYCPEIEKHLLCVHISWIAGYDRYYRMEEGDLELYEAEQETFCKKYEKEIKAYRTEKLIGAGALRDYDQDGIFYARIKIGDTFFSVPPVRDDKQM